MTVGKRLSARLVATIKAPGLYADGNNLYLAVGQGGAKSWLFIWNRGGRRREHGLGGCRDVTLAEAREKAIAARRAILAGKDPIAERKRSTANTFGAVAEQFIKERVEPLKNAAHRRHWTRSLTELSAPLKNLGVDTITVEDVANVIRPVWRDRPETGRKLRIHLGRLFEYAAALGMRTAPNPAAWRGNLRDILPANKITVEHRAALPWQKAPGFVARLREQDALSARALEFLILTAARSLEVRAMTWAEINTAEKIWSIPAARSKTKRLHRVPLSSRAFGIIESVRPLSDGATDSLVFPGLKAGKPMSDTVFGRLFDRMGIKAGTLTAHGFRSSFRDWCGDATDAPRELAEAALAHVAGDATERAYRRGDAFEKRRALMQQWADYCGSSSK